MRISNVLPAVALASSATAQLHKLALAKGKQYFGSATDNYELKDAPYFAILTDGNEFGQIVPSNAQKWAYSEPTPGNFSFAGGDEVANLAEAEGLILRCHALVWHSQAPAYINNGPWTNETLIAAMRSHIKGMVEHYKGRCAHWDVVNEAFEEDGSYRKTVFYNTIGPEYIPIAFEEASKYDPNVKLYINDYNLEYNGAKAEATRQVVKSIKARGIKLDGVGLQGHLIVGKTPTASQLTTMVQSFAALDVEVAYTEIDVRHETLPPTVEKLAQQDKDYANVIASCLNVPKCIGLTIWDFTDKYSWIPGVFKGQGDALLWDFELKKKQVYWAVVRALGGTVATTTPGNTIGFPTATLPTTVATSTATIGFPTTTLTTTVGLPTTTIGFPTTTLTTTVGVPTTTIGFPTTAPVPTTTRIPTTTSIPPTTPIPTTTRLPTTTTTTLPIPTTTPTTTRTLTTTPTPTFTRCNRDNCLRALLRNSTAAASFCKVYTTSVVTVRTAIPSYAGGCSGSPSRVSSACKCVPTA